MSVQLNGLGEAEAALTIMNNLGYEKGLEFIDKRINEASEQRCLRVLVWLEKVRKNFLVYKEYEV